MEIVIKTLVLLISLFSFQGVIADDNTTSDDEDEKVEILVPTPSRGPRMPGKVFIECHYSIGRISFILPNDVRYLDFSISEDSNLIWEGDVTSLNPTAFIPVLSGKYSITCRTNENQIFNGTLTY